jgi:elongation factor P
MKMKATQVRTGDLLDMDGVLHKVLNFAHVTPGKGNAHMQFTLRNLETGNKSELRLASFEIVEKAYLESFAMVYQYQDGDGYVFMNMETFDQISIHEDDISEQLPYLLTDMEVTAYTYEGRVVSVELPLTVDLEVTQTAPKLRGATVTNAPKPATLETGLVVNVPSFVEAGQKVRVDTRTGQYLERAD